MECQRAASHQIKSCLIRLITQPAFHHIPPLRPMLSTKHWSREKIKLLRSISIRLARKTDSVRQRSDRPSLCCERWHEKHILTPTAQTCTALLLSCNAQLCPICSIHPSSHPFIPLTCSSLDHGMDRQTTTNTMAEYMQHSGWCVWRYIIFQRTHVWVVGEGSKMWCGFLMLQGHSICW